MSEVQKIIKYSAVAFAFFLIFTIFFGIYQIGFAIFDITENESESKDIYIDQYHEKDAILNIDTKIANLQIVYGDTLSYETKNPYIKIKRSKNKILVMEKKKHFFRRPRQNKVLIKIPKNLIFDKVNIKNESGNIKIENLKTKEFLLNMGAGKTVIQKLNVQGKTSIQTGFGKTKINASLLGQSKINCGVGKFQLHIMEKKKDYKIKANTGLGYMKIDNQKISDNTIIGNGKNKIDISAGIGKMEINFAQ